MSRISTRVRAVLIATVVAGVLAGAVVWKPSLVAALGVGGGGGTSGGASGASGVKFFNARRGDLRVTLSEEGKLRAIRSHNIFPQLSGQVRITFLATEGAAVKKGDLLVSFDKKQFEDALRTTTGELEAAKRALAIAEEAAKIQESSAASAVKLAETKLDESEVALKTYQEMEGPQKLNKTDTDIGEARGKLTEALKKLSEAERKTQDELFVDDEQRRLLEGELASAKDDVRIFRGTVESLSMQRKIFRAYEYPQSLKTKTQAVENAKLEVEKARVAAKGELQQKREEVLKQKDLIARHARQVEDLTSQIAKSDLFAPVDGLVIYGDPNQQHQYYGQQIKVGSEWYGANTIMTIPDLSAFEIDFNIAEEYRGRLKMGAGAIITVEAIPGLTLSGALSKISNLARPRVQYDPSSPKVFDGTVTPAGQDERMVSGMTARIEILTEELKNVISVPIEAVFNEDGKAVCYVRENGRAQRREVAPGKSNDHYVEITDGLREGEEVYLTPPEDAAAGASAVTTLAKK